MDYIPYCGLPPVPAELGARWNTDPLLMGALAVFAFVGTVLLARTERKRLAAFLTSNLVLWIAFVSPLCALSMALFSARLAQHMLIAIVAAPLLAWAVAPRGAARLLRFANPVVAAAIFMPLFWFWHLPYGYALSLNSDAAYWAMHLSVFAAAFWLWLCLMVAAESRAGSAGLAAFATSAQLSVLSALLFFAGRHWHAWHAFTTQPWGFQPLADQQLAAAIMWTVGGLTLLCFCSGLALRLLQASVSAEHNGGTGLQAQ